MDHTGNPAGFPASTTLIVGPGFKETMLPGYPTDPSSHILEADYAGRDLRQLDFGEESHNLTIGGFRAIDFFDDGSFYLLESPGVRSKQVQRSDTYFDVAYNRSSGRLSSNKHIAFPFHLHGR